MTFLLKNWPSSFRDFVDVFCSKFNVFTWARLQMCFTAPIQSALENTDPGAPNGGWNVRIRPLGVDFTPFEMAELPKKMIFVHIFANYKSNYKATWPLQNSPDRLQMVGFRSLNNCSTFNPPLEMPGSVLSSALWISTVRHFGELVKYFF